MKKSMLFVLIALLGMPMAAAAAGISGDCSNCHTMHNSQAGEYMVEAFDENGDLVPSAQLNDSLLRYDCLACHARGGDYNIFNGMGGAETQIPQVYHTATQDLAGGNFAYISGTKDRDYDGNAVKINPDYGLNRKGHNVKDLFAGGDKTATFTRPPGFRSAGASHTNAFKEGADLFGAFTCAGAAGCHGTRNQNDENGNPLTGIAAVSGAHHQSRDGLKSPSPVSNVAHSGTIVADGYRFIPGLKGMGSPEAARWQNLSSDSHNEYYGDNTPINQGTGCTACHIADETTKTDETALNVPNQSMSGFCSTCHGEFHSAGENGTSGAFKRHPSDYVIPNRDEYSAYQAYNVSAPVARPDLNAIGNTAAVRPGTDMVMCLSCHVAHASPYDGMLRFDYADMTATAGGGTGTDGCFACHTNK